MKRTSFAHEAPKALGEALELLSRHGTRRGARADGPACTGADQMDSEPEKVLVDGLLGTTWTFPGLVRE